MAREPQELPHGYHTVFRFRGTMFATTEAAGAFVHQQVTGIPFNSANGQCRVSFCLNSQF